MNSNIKRQKKGFTLLEILLVIAAIGILAAIVLVAINPTRQINQARQAAVNSDKNTIEKALQQALIDTGSYPSSVIETQRDICKTGTEQVGGATDCTNKADLRELVPTYIASIPTDTTYTLARGNDGRVYVNTVDTAANFSCPTGYIKVPGNSLYQTKDFCVMKYEAKAVEISNPTVGLTTPNTGVNTIANNTTATTSASNPPRAIASVASGYPIANINQTTAASYCTNAGASLITNAEWMTIVRNIESVPSNWTGGAVGNGGLWRGHTDNNPPNALAANADDNQGYEGTGNTSPSIEKRTHTLSNGETIWDISGNVWEWTSDTIQGQNKPNNSSGALWQQWTAISNFGNLSYDLTRPSNTSWNSSQNIGQYYAGTVTGTTTFAFLRGGHWGAATLAGVFTLDLNHTPSLRFLSWFPLRLALRGKTHLILHS
jgi:prepilin-type N-terminal cleavage/methylation domain-containing protein